MKKNIKKETLIVILSALTGNIGYFIASNLGAETLGKLILLISVSIALFYGVIVNMKFWFGK